MSAEAALKKGFDWRSYDENFADQSDEMLALYCYYESTDVLTMLQEASVEEGTQFKVRLSVPIRVGELNEDLLKVEVWLSSEDAEEARICGQVEVGGGCTASTSMAPEDGQRANATGTGPAKLNRSISGKNASASISCRFLPDIIFDVSLPCTYPSETAPTFTLSCDWLNESQLAELCLELDKIWQDNANMPVIFTWSEWLSANLVEFLDMAVEPATVIITPLACLKFNKGAGIKDERAISLFSNADDLIYKFLRHNYLEEIKSFRKSPQTCLICFDEKLGSEFYRLNDCKHHFCIECMTGMCRMHAKEGTVQLLKCPEAGCGEHISHDILQQCLHADEFERYEKLMLQRTLDSMDDVMYCPQCQQPIIMDKEDSHAMCLLCLVDFCRSCKDKWHTGPCEDELKKITKKVENLKITPEELMEMTPEDLKRLYTSNSEFLLALRRKALATGSDDILKKFPKCPNCKAPIQKSAGCNKITCICGTILCYVCRKKIMGYDHFSDGGCKLWNNDEGIARAPARERNPVQMAMVRLVQENPELRNQMTSCASCHQRILKQGNNNHLKCPLCSNSMCCCCKKRLVGNITLHFRNSDCKQHSD